MARKKKTSKKSSVKKLEPEAPFDARWMEIAREDIDGFQDMVRLLVDFDNKTGRWRRYGDPEIHYMRAAIGECDPNGLRALVVPEEQRDHVYSVIAQFRGPGGCAITEWTHEDSIMQDRCRADPEHPVHQIPCLTDMYKRATPLSDLHGLEQETFRRLFQDGTVMKVVMKGDDPADMTAGGGDRETRFLRSLPRRWTGTVGAFAESMSKRGLLKIRADVLELTEDGRKMLNESEREEADGEKAPERKSRKKT